MPRVFSADTPYKRAIVCNGLCFCAVLCKVFKRFFSYSACIVQMKISLTVLFNIEQQTINFSVICRYCNYFIPVNVQYCIRLNFIEFYIRRDFGLHFVRGTFSENFRNDGVSVYFEQRFCNCGILISAQNKVMRIKMVLMRMRDQNIFEICKVVTIIERICVSLRRKIQTQNSVYQNLSTVSEFFFTCFSYCIAISAITKHCGNAFRRARS